MWKASGRSGLGRLVEKSHSSCSSPKVAMETLREGLAFRASTSGHEPWLAATATMSKQAVRKGGLLWTVESGACCEVEELPVEEMAAAGGWARRLAACGCQAVPAEEMTAAGGRVHRLAACGCCKAPAEEMMAARRERVSATTFSTPGTYRMSAVYSAM